MLDVAVAYNRYRFLGDEFLTWLWFAVEHDQQGLKGLDAELQSLALGDRVVLENRQGQGLERITIRGDQAGLEEGMVALGKGALVTEISLVFKTADHQWRFAVKGESLNISSLKTPAIGRPESPEDFEGFVLEKAYLYEKVLKFMELAYRRFVKLRLSKEWKHTLNRQIKDWIRAQARKPA